MYSPKDHVHISRDPVDRMDRYTIAVSFPWDDLREIKTPEEFRGWLISKIEALLAKGADWK